MNFIELLVRFINASVHPRATAEALRLRMLRVLSVLNGLRTQVLTKAYAVYQGRGIAQANGFVARRGFTTQEGVGILLAGIFAVIFLYFVAYAVPGALTAIATTALTSVNGGVQTIFQVLFSIVAVFTFLLILVAVIQKVVS